MPASEDPFEKAAMAVASGFSFAIRLIGPLFVCLAASLMVFCAWVFFRALLPLWHGSGRELLEGGGDDGTAAEGGGGSSAEPRYGPPAWGVGWSLWGWADCIFSATVVVQLIGCYFSTVLTKPGYAPLIPASAMGAPALGPKAQKMCDKCNAPKPKRAHHCSICNRCVLKMDHHCPWVSNCVGQHNHKTFFLFLFYLWFSCVYVAFHAYPTFKFKRSRAEKAAAQGAGGPFSSLSGWDEEAFGMKRATAGFGFVLTLSVAIALGFMMLWQAYLALTQQTTIEFYENRFEISQARKRGATFTNPYDLGWRTNFKYFFGADILDWRWLAFWVPPIGDGMVFPTRNSELHIDDADVDDDIAAGAAASRAAADYVAGDPTASHKRQRAPVVV